MKMTKKYMDNLMRGDVDVAFMEDGEPYLTNLRVMFVVDDNTVKIRGLNSKGEELCNMRLPVRSGEFGLSDMVMHISYDSSAIVPPIGKPSPCERLSRMMGFKKDKTKTIEVDGDEFSVSTETYAKIKELLQS